MAKYHVEKYNQMRMNKSGKITYFSIIDLKHTKLQKAENLFHLIINI